MVLYFSLKPSVFNFFVSWPAIWFIYAMLILNYLSFLFNIIKFDIMNYVLEVSANKNK